MKKFKHTVFFSLFCIVIAAVWLDWRMSINQDAAYKSCLMYHDHSEVYLTPIKFPTPDEIMEDLAEIWKNNDIEGFHSYVVGLYRGDGTNYVPAIALSGWHDRMLFAELESANEKYSRLRHYSVENPMEMPESHKTFFCGGQHGLSSEIGRLKRDFQKDGKLSLRLLRPGGLRTSRRNAPHPLNQRNFDDMENFLRNTPSIFITNDENIALAVEVKERKRSLKTFAWSFMLVIFIPLLLVFYCFGLFIPIVLIFLFFRTLRHGKKIARSENFQNMTNRLHNHNTSYPPKKHDKKNKK